MEIWESKEIDGEKYRNINNAYVDRGGGCGKLVERREELKVEAGWKELEEGLLSRREGRAIR